METRSPSPSSGLRRPIHSGSFHGMPPNTKHHRKRHRHHKILPPDKNVVYSVISIGRGRGLSDDYILTALMVGLQESRLNNLDHGDGSSVGWRQEVAKYYGSVASRMNVPASVNRFYDELTRTPRLNRSLGHWGQAVQRSGFPDAYDPHLTEARQILERFDASRQSTASR